MLKHFEPWYALMFTDGSVSATSTGGVKAEEIRNFYSSHTAVAVVQPKRKAAPISAVERMVLEDRGMAAPVHADGPARADGAPLQGGPAQPGGQPMPGGPGQSGEQPGVAG